MTKEMYELRKMLDAEGIDWHDKSELGLRPIWRTHFEHRGYHWSVIHGFGTFGGFDYFGHEDKGLLEVMSDAINNGEPIGWLTAERVMQYVRGEETQWED